MRLNIKGDKAEVVMQPEYTVDGSGNQIEANLTYLGKAGGKIIFQSGTSEIKTFTGKKAKKLKGTTVNNINKQLVVSADAKRLVWLENPNFNGDNKTHWCSFPLEVALRKEKIWKLRMWS